MTMVNVQMVDVTVDATGAITCSPDPVRISGKRILIAFCLKSAGWNFPDSDAIVVTDPGAQFPAPSWTVKPTLAGLYDHNDAAGDFKYTITVVNSSTGDTYSLDPTVQNTGA